MSLERPIGASVERRNPRIEQLESEIGEQEEALRQNEEKLQGLVADLEEEKGKDPVELEKRRRGVLERLDNLKGKINSKLLDRASTYAMVGGMGAAMFGGTEVATMERLASMGKGAVVGAAVAGVVWGAQRIKFAIENRKAYREARGE